MRGDAIQPSADIMKGGEDMHTRKVRIKSGKHKPFRTGHSRIGYARGKRKSGRR